MKKFISVFIVFILLVGCGTSNKPEGINIVVSFGVLEEIVTEVGGDKVNARNIVAGDVHHWEPTSKDLVLLNSADMIVIVGAGFEPWISSISNAFDKEKLVDTSLNIDLIRKEEIVDPHIWLSPLNLVKQAEVVLDALVLLDNENESYYRSNFESYKVKLVALDEMYRASNLKGTIVSTHESFGYLAKAYGLKMESVEGLAPSSEPSITSITRVINEIKRLDVAYIFYDNKDDRKVADMIAKEVGIKAALLSPLEVMEDDYISMMLKNLAVLKEALGS